MKADDTDQHGNAMALGVMVAFLRSGRLLDHAASLGLLLTGAWLAWHGAGRFGGWVWACLIATALAEKYLAWRVALDAELFAVLAAAQTSREIDQFDIALAAFLGSKVGRRAAWRAAGKVPDDC